jgi:hypothetical protein
LKATTIMSLEEVLWSLSGGRNRSRDAERYNLTIFGTPETDGTWAWRFEGHHLSLNFTIVKGHATALTPSMMGADPAEVRVGSRTGLRALKQEEDLARALVKSLDRERRGRAIVDPDAPSDILLGPGREAALLKPLGIAAAELDAGQQEVLRELIAEYLRRYRSELIAFEIQRLEQVKPEDLHFAWAGGLEPGQPHYYRIQSPHFVLEYDNTQAQANHIHTVWRDLQNDFGRDILREHYENSGHHDAD